MDKAAIKNYAVAARRKLMEAIRQKAFSLYVSEEGAQPPDVAYSKLRADGVFLTPEQADARLKLCAYLAQLGDDMGQEKAFSHMLEEVAYTWFNRLIALRYMEVNEYLPSGVRILSSAEAGRAEPDAMREAERLPYVNQDKISDYRADTGPGADERLYKYLLISQCNALHDILPGMFQKINDYTELLLPDSLYQRGGIVYDLVNAISEDDFKDQVQIIGWLYQYYVSEKKDEVFAALKKNVKINKETIPAATQLFTPEWIVKYMVENSLGRLWLERHPSPTLRASWKYYVDEAEQEPEVRAQLDALIAQSPVNSPEDITLIDPCMGSGHILVYAFDVLYQIYASQGYAEREIPGLILQHNIYGLNIDGRAAQLAYFALMMKARGYSRRFFRPKEDENIPQPHVHAFIESDGAGRHHLEYMGDGMSKAEQEACKASLGYLIDLFRDAREYGSILKIEQELDYDKLRQFVKALRLGQIGMDAGDIAHVSEVLLGIVEIAECLTRKYDVVVTNPPYMGSKGVDDGLAKYLKENYPATKSDTFSAFIEECGNMGTKNALIAMFTPYVWMFLPSYEKLRDMIISKRNIVSLIQFEYSAFEEAVVPVCTFILSNTNIKAKGTYFRLTDFRGGMEVQRKKTLEAIDNQQCGYIYFASTKNFTGISGKPIAYWAKDKLLLAFKELPAISDLAVLKHGMSTSDNNRFLRFWQEVCIDDINFEAVDKKDTVHFKWYPILKGGEFRKWYGNHYYVVNWKNDGQEIKEISNVKYPYLKGNLDFVLGGQKFFFQEGITWSSISSAQAGFRYYPNGFLFTNKGQTLFPVDSTLLKYYVAFLNTKVVTTILKILSPTIGFESGSIGKIPISLPKDDQLINLIFFMSEKNIDISRNDWDSFETSWDFQQHPFLAYKGATLAESFQNWQTFTAQQFSTLKSNEEELNRIFIDIYGLQDELTPEVQDKDVTIRRADLGRDIRSFISYAVGCMFGRYSLDEPGLVFAGGAFEPSRYKTFLPEDDNILPIGSADYFDDDIVVRFTEFVRAVYSEATLDENLNFIADALYPTANGSAKEKIRRYFLNDFYKDHLKIYQKRPIYWLMDSGKKDGFKALFYLHRYEKFTVARARTDYLHPLQRKYEAEIGRLEMLSGATDNAREKAANSKAIEILQRKIEECRAYDLVVAHIAHRQIELDLDDGVKVNYAKFQGVEVPMDGGKTATMNLLAKIV